MHPNILFLKKVLTEEKITYTTIPDFPDALILRNQLFIRATTPFNSEAVSVLCRDKSAIHALCEGRVPMPKTRSFLDPQGKYPELVQNKTIPAILTAVSDFIYPRIIKMNSGEQGKNVFIVHDETESRAALERIFEKSSRNYDYMALIQEYIEPKRELRAAIAGGKFVFAYDRESKELIENELEEKLESLSKTVLEHLDLSWGALDFIEDGVGDIYLLEANTKPNFEGFISYDKKDTLKGLYKIALKDKGLI